MFKHNTEGLLGKTLIVLVIFIFALLLWFGHLDKARYIAVQKDVVSRLVDAGFTYDEYVNCYYNSDVEVYFEEPYVIGVISKHSDKFSYFSASHRDYTADDVMSIISVISAD